MVNNRVGVMVSHRTLVMAHPLGDMARVVAMANSHQVVTVSQVVTVKTVAVEEEVMAEEEVEVTEAVMTVMEEAQEDMVSLEQFFFIESFYVR